MSDLRDAMRRLGWAAEPTKAEKIGHVLGLVLSLAIGATMLYFGALLTFGLTFGWRGLGGVVLMVVGGWWALKTGEQPR